MNKWAHKDFEQLNKIIFGLPVPHAPVACSWQLAADLQKLGHVVLEMSRFDILQVELIRNDNYLCVVHSDLVASEYANNSKIAFIINLAKRFKTCQFRILNFNNAFENSEGFPNNLQLWDFKSSEQIKNLITSQMLVWN